MHIDYLPATLGVPEKMFGMTHCPGTNGTALAADLHDLREAGVQKIVCLAEDGDLARNGVEDYPREAKAAGFELVRFPIADYDTPPSAEAVDALLAAVLDGVRSGRHTVIHCRAGLGRTGTVVACCLVRLGLEAKRAIEEVRRIRPRTVETPEQVAFVERYAGWVQAQRTS
jgi:protein-tyrosine phosphatase